MDPKLFQAKKKLGEQYKNEEGFLGVGIGNNILNLYVSNHGSPVAREFSERKWFEGFKVVIKVAGAITAY